MIARLRALSGGGSLSVPDARAIVIRGLAHRGARPDARGTVPEARGGAGSFRGTGGAAREAQMGQHKIPFVAIAQPRPTRCSRADGSSPRKIGECRRQEGQSA